ncbi:MAG TPA: alkaline phosphatase family protein, partial [Thermomicrobiales bacterium]|nr:alkaline phosphatase family protein [Thermomicrobiales bacterium]
MRRQRHAYRSLFFSVFTLIVLGLGPLIATLPGARATAQEATPTSEGSAAQTANVIFFAADGMRPDLVDHYAAEGLMPAMSGLIARGTRGDNGLEQGFPPNSGVGWYNLSTGTWPSEHGSTNNTFHRVGDHFWNATTFSTPGVLQSDTIMQAAERAGKTVVAVEWLGTSELDPPLQGPMVDFRTFYSDRGVLTNYDLPNQPAGAKSFGLSYQRVDLQDASGWTNVPPSYSPAKEQHLQVGASDSTANVDRTFDLYIYDSTDDQTSNYDRVLVVPAPGAPVAGATP